MLLDVITTKFHCAVQYSVSEVECVKDCHEHLVNCSVTVQRYSISWFLLQ